MTFNLCVTLNCKEWTLHVTNRLNIVMVSYLKIHPKLTKLWPGQGPSIWPWPLTYKYDLDRPEYWKRHIVS